MRLADFIVSDAEPILSEWEIFARSIGAGQHLDIKALRDHACQILEAPARDMKSDQSSLQPIQKSRGKQNPMETLTNSMVHPTCMRSIALGLDSTYRN